MNTGRGYACWRKSTRSNGSSDCVEVGVRLHGRDTTIGVRDTKDRDGAALAVDAATWRAFLAQLPAH